MPERFRFQDTRVGLWTLLRRDATTPRQVTRNLSVVGRLGPGHSVEQAHAALETGLRQAEETFPDGEQGWQVRVVPFVGADFHLSGVAPGFSLLFAAAVLSLLIACMNIATVMAARWTARQKETAVRLALGAGRFRLLRQFLSESVLLSALGGLAAVAFTYAGVRALLAAAPPDARFYDFAIDARVLGFTAALTLLTGLLSGLAPALLDTKLNLCDELKQGQLHSAAKGVRQRLRTLLVVSEIAVTTVLLVVTGGLVEGYRDLHHSRLDFDAHNLLVFGLDLDPEKYTDSGPEDSEGATPTISPRALDFQEQVAANLAGSPAISNIEVALAAPPFDAYRRRPVFRQSPAGAPATEPLESGFNAVGPAFFEVLGVPMVRGRGFTKQDGREAPAVAIVNNAFARRYWPQSDPLGAYVWLGPASEAEPRQIVGIVADYTNRGMLEPPAPAIYVPHRQQPISAQSGQQPASLRVEFVARLTADSASASEIVRREVARLDSFQAVGRIATVEQMIAQGADEVMLGIGLQAPLVGFAFLLTAVGIYGVLAFAVHRRTHEFGIRMALGADGGQVRRVVLKQGLRMATIGLLVGVPLALASVQVLGKITAVMRSAGWEVFGVTAGLVLVVTAAASYMPAQRATRVDPMKALRAE
jgi:putative ABC transport system permease protein